MLTSLYYEDRNLYEELYNNRIKGESCVRLNFRIKNNDAFYCITPELHNLHIKTLELNMKVQSLIKKLPPVASKHFATNSLIEEIFLTNNIEGVYSTKREIEGVLKKLEKGDRKSRFAGIVNKYNMMSKAEVPLKACEDIRSIYDELVLDEVAKDDPANIPDGKIFRKELAEVKSATGKVIHKGIYPETEIMFSMEKALQILDSTLPALEATAIFHYLFGYIHPFYDGNGRTSRFISSYLLAKQLNNNLIGYRLSYTIKENISEYYKAFKICNDEKSKGDITPFILTFIDIVYKSMTNLYHSLQSRLSKLYQYATEMSRIESFCDTDLNQLSYILIQARLFSEKGITKKELINELEISMTTLNRRLDAVRKTGYLKEKVVGHALYFEFDVDKLDE